MESGGRRSRTPYSPQRQQVILRTLRRQGRVDVADLAEELAVTGETIRKDLIGMEAKGLLVRVHGGAVPVGDHSFEPDVAVRTEFAEEKHRIAVAATAHLPVAGSILIDAGSTTGRLVPEIPEGRELTVFTNALQIAIELLERPQVTVYPLGGRLRRQTVATVGPWTYRLLEELNVDVAFLGTNGISLERGLTTPDPAEAQAKALMVKAAARRILLADHSKFDRVSLVKHADLSDIDLIITDTGLPPEVAERLRANGVEVQQV
jgi:DeoR family fructose operon transcriptional repressor